MLPLQLSTHIAFSAAPPQKPSKKIQVNERSSDNYVLIASTLSQPPISNAKSVDEIYLENPNEDNLKLIFSVYQNDEWGARTIFPLDLPLLGIKEIKDRIVKNDNIIISWFVRCTALGHAVGGQSRNVRNDTVPDLLPVYMIFNEANAFRAMQENRILDQIVQTVERRVLELIKKAHRNDPISENIQMAFAHEIMGNLERAYFHLELAQDLSVKKFNVGYVNVGDLVSKIIILHRLVNLSQVKGSDASINYLKDAQRTISSLSIYDREKGVIYSVDQAYLWAEVNSRYLQKKMERGEIGRHEYHYEILEGFQNIADANREAIAQLESEYSKKRYWSNYVTAKASIVKQYANLAKIIREQEWIDDEEFRLRNGNILPGKYFPRYQRVLGSKTMSSNALKEFKELQRLAKHIDKMPGDVYSRALNYAQAAIDDCVMCEVD